MSRSATASTPKNPPQLPSKSAWARGPPQQNSANSTPRSQSPAPPTPVSATNPASFHATHSRRPSTLGQGVSVKDGVSIPRNAVKQGSPVTFGSIDDAPAPISSSPASAPAVKPAEGVKSFGSVVVQNGGSDAAKSAVTNRPPPLAAPSTSSSQAAATATSTPSPVPKFDTKNIAKLFFQGPSQSVPTSAPETASPASRSAPLPSQAGQAQPYQPPFAPRQGQNGNPSAPRSPVYSRPMVNGQANSVGVSGRPQAGSGGPSAGPAPTALPSPRLTPHPPPGPPSGIPPGAMWPPYYYHPSFVSGVPPDQFYSPQWPGHLLPPQHQPPPPHHPSGPAPPSAGLPMSPRNPPLPLQQVPGTPTQSHSIPPILHPPHPSAPQPPPSVTSPPSTPATANRSTSLSASAGAFVPAKKVSIKNSSGQEVTLDTLKRTSPPSVVPPVSSSPASVKADVKRTVVRIETPEQKQKRLAEEKAKEEDSEEKSKSSDSLVRANEVAARREIEEQERRKAEERKAKEEADRAEKERKEAEERAALEEKERRQAEARAAREEEERREAKERAAREAREKEEREKERMRLEEARAQREARERAEKERAEQERLRKTQEEEEARAKEAERQRKAEEDMLKAAETSEDAHALPDDAEPTSSLPEEGEVEDEVSQSATAATEEPNSANKSAAAPQPQPSPPPVPHISAELPTKPLEKEILRIDTSLPPSPEHPRKRPGPLNLTTTINNANIAPSLPSALAAARHIEDINCITYPQGIRSPKLELNVNTQKGKFRYDRDFLLQFMNICKEKPDNLPPLDVIGLEPSDMSHTMSRGGSGRSRSSNSLSMPPNSRSPNIGLGFLPGSMGKSAGSGFQMGQFSTTASKMSSEERFQASNAGRSVSVTGPLGSRPPTMIRTISQSGTGRDRTRSKRGANESSRASVTGNAGPAMPVSSMGPPMEPIAPLEASANRWVATSTRRSGSGIDSESPEIVDRKVKALLNKLTMERFDSISDQIIAWANKSERETDGRTLIQVIKLVFEKATDEATFSEMYARLCRKMMEQISPKVQDDGIKNTEGKPFAGGQLFRKYLLNRCQEDFERGWVAKETTAAAAATKATEDQAVKEANEQTKGEESELYSEEYYAAAKAKRRGLGLIRFIGELFKLQMLTERIMHECIKKLLGNVENPEEEEIESLCKLLTTVGSLLDTAKARAHLDVYFSRMRELTKNKNVNARMIFMLQDVIELRERRWIPRNVVAAPTTIAQVHETAAKEKQLAQEKDSYMRQNTSMSRGGSRRGGNRDAAEAPHPDGWSVAGSSAPTRQPPKAGDLSQFGKISKTTPISFGPGSIFTGKKGTDPKNRDPPMSRTPSMSSNMFSMLQNPDAAAAEPSTSKSSRPPSRKPSVDLGAGAPSDPAPQRRRLQLLPRSKPVGEESKASTPAVSESGSDDEIAGESGSLPPGTMSEAETKARIDEDTKEFFSIRMLDEAESYFSSLPTEHRHWLVDALVTKSIEMKEPDVVLVSNLFIRVREKELCSPGVFEEGFSGLAELLDDLAVDIPKAWPYFAILLRGSGLDQDEERRGRIAEKTMDPDKLNRLL